MFFLGRGGSQYKLWCLYLCKTCPEGIGLIFITCLYGKFKLHLWNQSLKLIETFQEWYFGGSLWKLLKESHSMLNSDCHGNWKKKMQNSFTQKPLAQFKNNLAQMCRRLPAIETYCKNPAARMQGLSIWEKFKLNLFWNFLAKVKETSQEWSFGELLQRKSSHANL